MLEVRLVRQRGGGRPLALGRGDGARAEHVSLQLVAGVSEELQRTFK